MDTWILLAWVMKYTHKWKVSTDVQQLDVAEVAH